MILWQFFYLLILISFHSTPEKYCWVWWYRYHTSCWVWSCEDHTDHIMWYRVTWFLTHLYVMWRIFINNMVHLCQNNGLATYMDLYVYQSSNTCRATYVTVLLPFIVNFWSILESRTINQDRVKILFLWYFYVESNL